MRRSLLTPGLLMIFFFGGTCQAQQIDSSYSRTIALTHAPAGQAHGTAAMDSKIMRNSVMTRAIVHRDRTGKRVVRCHVTRPALSHASGSAIKSTLPGRTK